MVSETWCKPSERISGRSIESWPGIEGTSKPYKMTIYLVTLHVVIFIKFTDRTLSKYIKWNQMLWKQSRGNGLSFIMFLIPLFLLLAGTQVAWELDNSVVLPQPGGNIFLLVWICENRDEISQWPYCSMTTQSGTTYRQVLSLWPFTTR